jgi:5-methyltetrahydrofolate--homocysteine methyltransferase
MARIELKARVREGLLILDGAMGTELAARGAKGDECNEYLNIEKPEIVSSVHRAYLEAGSDIVITNSFGGNRYALNRHGMGHLAEKVNKAAAKIAREAAGEDKWVLGDIGPTGDFMEPLGSLKAGELKDAFCYQAEALAAGGVDGFIIETMTALDEISVAIEAARGAVNLPILATMSFDKTEMGFATMMGVQVETAVTELIGLGVDALGFNCGTATMGDYAELTRRVAGAVAELGKEAVIIAEPNAGMPELEDGQTVYRVGADEFATGVKAIYDAGARVIGGCCGTNPELIRAAVKTLRG